VCADGRSSAVMDRVDVLRRPSRTSWDEARQVAEAAVPLLGVCLGACSLMQGCPEPPVGVLGVLVVSTASFGLLGELIIRADRRARHRSAALAQERRRIMNSVFDEPLPRSEPPVHGR
jgi:hypothetical protein